MITRDFAIALKSCNYKYALWNYVFAGLIRKWPKLSKTCLDLSTSWFTTHEEVTWLWWQQHIKTSKRSKMRKIVDQAFSLNKPEELGFMITVIPSDDSVWLEDILSLISKKNQMKCLCDWCIWKNTWSFKVWKRMCVKAWMIVYEWSMCCKKQGCFRKLVWINHTLTTNLFQGFIFQRKSPKINLESSQVN